MIYVFILQIKMLTGTICVYMDSLRPFSKCRPWKMTKSQNSDFPLSSLYLSQIYNIHLQMYIFESDRYYFIRHRTGAPQWRSQMPRLQTIMGTNCSHNNCPCYIMNNFEGISFVIKINSFSNLVESTWQMVMVIMRLWWYITLRVGFKMSVADKKRKVQK